MPNPRNKSAMYVYSLKTEIAKRDKWLAEKEATIRTQIELLDEYRREILRIEEEIRKLTHAI